MTNLVEHPSHYIGRYGMETIDVIKNFTDDMDGIEGYYVGNILKYICRWKKKNGYQDLCKAEVYLHNLKTYVNNKDKFEPTVNMECFND